MAALKDRLAGDLQDEDPGRVVGPQWRDPDVCFAPVLSVPEAIEHSHNVDRRTFVEVLSIRRPGPAPRFNRTEPEIVSPPPHAGQHTDEILAAAGFDAERAAKLRDGAPSPEPEPILRWLRPHDRHDYTQNKCGSVPADCWAWQPWLRSMPIPTTSTCCSRARWPRRCTTATAPWWSTRPGARWRVARWPARAGRVVGRAADGRGDAVGRGAGRPPGGVAGLPGLGDDGHARQRRSAVLRRADVEDAAARVAGSCRRSRPTS